MFRKLLPLTICLETCKGVHYRDLEARGAVLERQGDKWRVQREALKNVDWNTSDLMQAFEMSLSQKKPIDVILKQLAYDNGQHGKELIYSDVELEYNM